MKIDASEMLAFYDSIEKLRWHTENLIVFARGISADNRSLPLEPLQGFIDGLGTGGVFANFSQERNGYPLWGLDNLGELERIAKFSHTFRLACPTPEKPMLWRKLQPAWSTAILDFCAHSVPVIMGGWEEDDFFGSDIPTWRQCRVASLYRLGTMAEQFVSAICKHFTSSVQSQLSTARVMLERESAWVCTEMRKSGVIKDCPASQDIKKVQKRAEVKQALRGILAENPEVKQKKAGTLLRAQRFRVSATTIGEMLFELAAEGLYKGDFRGRDER
jgi:hypothetical protein